MLSNAELNGLTNAKLVEVYNGLIPKETDPLKAWKGKKELLVAKIEALQKAARPKPKKAEVPSGRTIREVAEGLLLEVVGERDGRKIGHTYEAILAKVLEEFPEADTTVACLRWYSVHLNREPNIKMPIRPRKRPAKAA